MVRAELSVRTFGRGGRAFVPDFRSASRPRHRGFDPARPLLCDETSARRTGKRRAFDRNPGRAPGFCSEISVDHRDFKPKLRRGATETSAPPAQLCTAAAGGSPRRLRGTLEGAQRAVHRRQPARLRPTTPRRCGSCAAALVTRQRSPARRSAHAPAATACKRPRARSVVRTPERHSERAMGAALTRPTGITSAPAGARACGV